jgi:glutathione S-transferase
MSDTIETDAIIEYLRQQFPATEGHIPLREKIGKLERERNEARKERDCWIFNAKELQKIVNGWEQERSGLKLMHKAEMKMRMKAEAERDKLRKVCDELAYCASQLGWTSSDDVSVIRRSESAVSLYNSLPHVIERNK